MSSQTFQAMVHVDRVDPVAPVRRRLFGSFVEHMGRGVYGGIYEPGHPTAGEDGFRGDVLDLVRGLGVTTVRYPGGNAVSGFRWEDSVGPRSQRPVRRDLAWHSLETNEVGLDEFARWCRAAEVELMYALNLGTRGVEEALDVHEYANHPGGTTLSDYRRANGSPDPHGIRMWCLGNEMDGPWQLGHRPAEDYGTQAAQVARALRMAESDLELVACGSSGSHMPTFGEWERKVLERCYDEVDYISCHAYYEELDDLASFLASGVDMDYFIERVAATADAVGAALKTTKRINISFDEWNVWYLRAHLENPHTDEWTHAKPVIEDTYTVADGVVVGGLLIALLRNADRVHAASLAQLVNVIAPIRTEPGGPAWKQTIYDPFALTARLATGEVLRTTVVSGACRTPRYGEVPRLDAVATGDSDQASVFLLNRDLEQSATVTIPLVDDLSTVAEAWLLHDEDLHATNSALHPDRVRASTLDTRIQGRELRVVLPRASWACVRLARPTSPRASG